MRICSGAGCLRVVADDVRYCDECKPQPVLSTDDIRIHTLTDREKYHFLYSSARWTKLRDLVVKSQPMCARCRLRLSVIVDHVVPAGIAIAPAQDCGYSVYKFAGFFLRSNLQGLCRECHYLKTLSDKMHTGAWPNVVEQDANAPKRVWSF